MKKYLHGPMDYARKLKLPGPTRKKKEIHQ